LFQFDPIGILKGFSMDASPLASMASSEPKSKPSTNTPKNAQYNSVVVDTNAIIKGAGLTRLLPSTKNLQSFYTVPGVFQEIVDKKAKQHLENLPFQLISREPSAKAIKAIADFAKKTGDYRELSLVDLHILALTYDLDVLGCGGDSKHLRSEPKRKLGGGRVVSLNPNESNLKESKEEKENESKEGNENSGIMENGAYELQIDEASDDEGDDPNEVDNYGDTESETESDEENSLSRPPNSWARIVNPKSASKKTWNEQEMLSKPFGEMNISNKTSQSNSTKATISEIQQEQKELEMGGQFSDAEDDESLEMTSKNVTPSSQNEDDDMEDDYGIEFADSDAEMSDEDCDIYILDPEEAESRKKGQWKQPEGEIQVEPETMKPESDTLDPITENELQSDFPSLSAAATVPYEGSDDDEPNMSSKELSTEVSKLDQTVESMDNTSTANTKKWATFGKDKFLFSSQGVEQHVKGRTRHERKLEWEKEKERVRFQLLQERNAANAEKNAKQSKNKKKNQTNNTSRIIGGMELSGQSEQVDDDGEGWVSVSNFKSIKAGGIHGFSFKDPKKHEDNTSKDPKGKKKDLGPPSSQRCACATTDFAMQNILLQMGMVLLSIDGMAVRRVKHWVTRCATCFTVYGGPGTGVNSNSNKLGGRLFCDKCGGSYLERVSASVDYKTGRFRLHLSKRRRHNKRGTKFSLPKPGKVRFIYTN